ncbi:hypothetical protein [Jeotgalibacillus malaysiensis]|uniref:hypothetical protein n=1 Tax=Jeotgalibacillus malaysiensis TaxID=1508404 RepID=UPI00384C8F17
MKTQELTIDHHYYNHNCDYNDLKLASERLLNASEEQFTEIKNEKWFTRVFDMVTFSKKNNIRMSDQISNVAQAQQIMLEIFVRLSERDSELSGLVVESFSKMERLSENDLILAEKIREIEKRYLLGLSKMTGLKDFSDHELEILGGLLQYSMKQFDEVSLAQKDYANIVLKYVNVMPLELDIDKALNQVHNNEVKKLMLNSCMEYGFLNQFNFEFMENYSELLHAFDFGSKTVEETKNIILLTYNLRGEEGFTAQFENLDVLIEEAFFIDFEEIDAPMVEDEIMVKDDLQITSILHIASNEVKQFRNAHVHIEAFIQCEGNIEFDHCVIYYNEGELSDEITLSEGANLTLKNSTIICKSIDETPFIQALRSNEIHIENCTFENCSYFITLNGDSSLTIDNSKILGPGSKFLCSYTGYAGSKLSLNNTFIKFSEEQTNIISHDAVFVSDSLLEMSDCFIYSDHKIDFNDEVIFQTHDLNFQNCSFENLSKCISSYGGEVIITESSFKNCNDLIDNSISMGSIYIHQCLFHNCENIVSGEDVKISTTQFIDCKNNILKGNGFTIEFCEFYNITHVGEKMDIGIVIPGSSIIFSGGKDAKKNKISKCLFNGVSMQDGFLIEGKYFHNPKNNILILVEDCNFQNCKTDSESGKIIKEYDFFFGLFNKRIEIKPVFISNCKGLDKVNEENGFTEEVVIKSELPNGVKIGSHLAKIMLGGINGLFVSKVLEHAFKDTDYHKE